ncbi:MAG: regulatory protein RecX [Armatimonadota bacterium]|nr:regulatory protein RecX [Armatimonadota bacterium]
MGVITAIEVQKKRSKRRSIFVDGEFVAGVHEDVAAALNLSVGQTFDRDRLVELLKAETVRKAYDRAVRLIAYRDRSESELRRRLLASDFSEEVVDEVIRKLCDAGLLNDERFSREWVESRKLLKPMGRAGIAWELRSKGVDSETVEQALRDFDEETEFALAMTAAERRLRKADRSDPTLRDKMASFLSRRGFDWDVIRKVLDELCPEDQAGG